MHDTSLFNCQQFFDSYGASIKQHAPNAKVVEIGSQDVNGSIRVCSPAEFEYIGVDFATGKGIDVVLTDPYSLPFESESVDVVVSNSCLEHSEMFWLIYLEIMRILKPTGIFYLNVPSNGGFHRYPVDCWRFYPDSGRALVTWAKRNGMNAELLESYTSQQIGDEWNDYVAIFLKDKDNLHLYPNRILNNKTDFTNGLVFGSNELLKPQGMPEDKLKMLAIKQIIDNQIKIG